MLYAKYMKQAMELAIGDDTEGSGFYYLEPSYRILMTDAHLTPDLVEDYQLGWDEVAETLKLEVERRNRFNDRARYVVDWVFNIITSAVDPAMLQEENELMKNVMDYMKMNHELNEREAEVERKEEVQEQKANVLQLVPGMNFSKRGAK